MVQCTVCPGSSDPIYIVSYYIKWGTTSWTGGKERERERGKRERERDCIIGIARTSERETEKKRKRERFAVKKIKDFIL